MRVHFFLINLVCKGETMPVVPMRATKQLLREWSRRDEALMAIGVEITVFLDVTQCNPTDHYLPPSTR
jgi:hypothetical protein